MKRLLLLIKALLCSINSFSQTDSTLTDSTKQVLVLPNDPNSSIQLFPFLNVVAPSPEAASLGRYGEIPVSFANGTNSPGIPIYEIISGTLRVPVELLNHSAGIKVNDIASSVGSGWSLHAGGAISRVVKGGLWDECSLGILNQVIPEQSNTADFYCFIGNLTSNIDYVDGMPDDFFYKFTGNAGKFLFNNRNLSNQNITPIPVSYPHSNLKIEWINQLNFRITDVEGTIYKFEAQEETILTQTLSARDNPCGTTYTSAWYLTEMISANRIDTIRFNYTSPVQVETNPIWSTTLKKIVNEFGNSTYTYQYAFQKIAPRTILLSEITHKNGKVTFTYANDRQDLSDTDAKRLTTITIFNKEASGTYSETKHFSLSHSYFICSDGYSQVDNPQYSASYHSDSTLLKRLRLDAVTEVSADNQSLPPFRLTYYQDNPLPIYASLAQDYWGASNGVTTNKNLLLWNTDSGLSQEPSSTYGADCKFNFNYAISGALKQMVYPTGGFVKFYYEPQMLNDSTKGGGIRIKKIITSDSDSSQIEQKKFNYLQSYFTNSAFSGDVTSEAYVHTTQVSTRVGGNTGNCNQWTLLPHTTYPEKVNFSLGSAASFMAYNEVEEYHENVGGQRLGKINYSYTISSDLISPDFPLELISTDWKRGLLLNKKTFSILPDSTEVKILEEQTTYQELLQTYKSRGYVARLTTNYDTYLAECAVNTPVYCDKYSSDNQYVFQEINQQSSILLPNRSIKLSFDQNGLNAVIDTVLFDFDSGHLQLTKTTDKNSDGKTYETINRYPSDFTGNTVYAEMVNRHILSPIVETEQKENTISLKKSRTNYKLWYPSTSFGNVSGFFAPISVETSENSATWETEVVMGEQLVSPTQNGYDLRARPVLYTTRKNVPTSLEWWEVLGKKDFLKKKSFLTQNQNFDYSKGELASNIDQNGFANYYVYDAFNRLKSIKDRDFNLLQSFQYHYATGINDKNYLKQSSYRITTTNESDGNDAQKAVINFNYIDGVGEPLETVGYKQSPLEKDIVFNTRKQDEYGRIFRKILPTPTNSTTGNFQSYSDILALAKTFYSDSAPVDSIVYEKSLLNRPKAQFGAGQAWYTANKNTKVFYESAGTDVRYYSVNSANSVILDGFYPANSLFKKRIIDEQGHTSIEIIDKQGRLVQRQVQKDTLGGFMTTYFCYDGLGRTRAILQPTAYNLNQTITATDQAHRDFVFAFEYDNRSRLIREDIPGAEERYSVYDKADRLVMQKDALQSEVGKWNFWKYDAFDREVMRGETGNIGFNQSYWASLFASHTPINETWGSGGYDGQSFPSAVSAGFNEIQMYTFYDQYDFVTALNTNLAFDVGNAFHTQHTNVTGLLTGRVKYNQTDHNQYFMEAQYYDYKNRPIQFFETHLLSPTVPNRKDFEYNFAGEVLKERAVLKNVNEAIKTRTKEYTYDHVGRKTSFKLGINGSTEKILQYSYDPIGRQIAKHYYSDRTYRQADSTFDYIFRPPNPDSNTIDLAKKAVNLLPGTSIVADSTNFYLAHIDTLNIPSAATMAGMQKMDFSYHIRGLMNCVNCQSNIPNLNALENDLYANKIEWETAGRYDGNIGKQSWKNRKDNNVRSYSYEYDASSRMTAANYTGSGNENYSLSQLTFDKNGNILKLKRKGFTGSSFGDIDLLTYTYTGNKLASVSDSILSNLNTKDFRDSSASVDYQYYANGNLKSDLNKGISNIEYNTYLNKPKKITLFSGNELIFNYDGAGTLIARTITDSTKWQYTPDEIYKDDSLYQISQDEGRITRKNGKYKFEFEYRDIWGNLRTSFADSDSLPVSGVYSAPIVLQINDYDPLGFEHFNNQEGKNNFLFQKQERILDLGLGYDFWKYRFSDAATGRFWMIDPLGSQYAHNSLYAFQENKLGKGVELEGAELAEFGHWISQNIDQALTFTDADDFTVLITTVSRGGKGVHIDGSTASTSDKVFAAGGFFLPVVSGGAVKKIVDAVKKIGPIADPGAKITKQLPSDWSIKTSKNGQGTKFSDPKNPSANNVRVQSGNPKSPNASQQNPYVKETKDGKVIDKTGKEVKSNTPEAHIPKEEFKYNKDEKNGF